MTKVTWQEFLERAGALEDTPTYCHLFPTKKKIEQGYRPGYSVCGVPRSEQAPHGHGNGNTDICPNCSMPRCPQCRKIYYP